MEENLIFSFWLLSINRSSCYLRILSTLYGIPSKERGDWIIPEKIWLYSNELFQKVEICSSINIEGWYIETSQSHLLEKAPVFSFDMCKWLGFLINFPRGDIEGFGVSIKISSQFAQAANSYPSFPFLKIVSLLNCFSSINRMTNLRYTQSTC